MASGRMPGPWCKLSRRIYEIMKIKWNQIVKGLAFLLKPQGKHGIFKQ